MHPHGVSRHGAKYFATASPSATFTPGVGLNVEPLAELVIEAVRRGAYADKPSRFDSFFGTETVALANRFRVRFNAPMAAIWEVEAADAFRCDMNCVGGEIPTLCMSYFAHRYWRGQQGPSGVASDGVVIEPLWELLLVPPVQAIRRLDEAAVAAALAA